MIEGFEYTDVEVGSTTYRVGSTTYRPGVAGEGPPVLLLHTSRRPTTASGHFIPEEAPEELLASLRDFLGASA